MRDALSPIVERMLALLPMHPEQLIWAPARTIQRHFPALSLQPLPSGSPFTSAVCQCDGYYEPRLTPGRPWLVYRIDVAAERVRFTLLHELGHYLIDAIDPGLYDLIDALAGSVGDPAEIEERICQRFAATLLISDKLLDHVVGSAHPTAAHIHALRRLSPASWQAVAVRVAQRLSGQGAIVLIRSPGRVAFVATSPKLHGTWPANSRVAPGGPLDRALQQAASNVQDTFAWNLPGARPLWCSTRKVHSDLAVAVMSTQQVTVANDLGAVADSSTSASAWEPAFGFDDPVRISGLLDDVFQRPATRIPQRTVPPEPSSPRTPDRSRAPRPITLDEVRAALRRGSLTVIASRPGHGKSALTLGLALDMACTRGARVALACLEMTNDEVAMRLTAASASVDLSRLRAGRLADADWTRLTRSLGRFAFAPVTFIPTRFGLSLTDLVEHCLNLTRRKELDLLVVDYIQLLLSNPHTADEFCDPREALSRLKHLAVELDLAVIAVSQLSRRAEERGGQRPELTDLSEYRAAVHVADVIALLHMRGHIQPWTWDDRRAAELRVFHHRFGPTGTATLWFESAYCRFSENRPSPPPPGPTGPGGLRPEERGHPFGRPHQTGSERTWCADPLPAAGTR